MSVVADDLPGAARRAADEIAAVIAGIDAAQLDAAVASIASAGTMTLHGVGRESLQMRGLAMRLHPLGLRASGVGDMACPPLGPGDLLVVSARPGSFSTVAALQATARAAGARTLAVTAQPSGTCAAAADLVLVVPAQTMADDLAAPTPILPMGSLYDGALYVLFELTVPRLRDRLGVTPEAMRARHTNLE